MVVVGGWTGISLVSFTDRRMLGGDRSLNQTLETDGVHAGPTPVGRQTILPALRG